MVDFFIRALKEHKREMVVDFFENTFDSLDEDYLYKARFYFLRLATRSNDGDKLFLDTLSSYDKKKQELVLFQIKMDLECAIEIFMNGEFKQDWEVKRYHNIENPYIVTTLMSCSKCGSGSQYADQISLLSFLRIKESNDIVQKSQHIDSEHFNCTKCGSKLAYHLDFFSLLDDYYLLDEEFRYLAEL
jgi:ribosomal protein S27AE